jgi:hypothetical protein
MYEGYAGEKEGNLNDLMKKCLMGVLGSFKQKPETERITFPS